MSHDLGMKSRVHPKYKTKYRVGNWAEYDRALVQRGDITLWISTDAMDAWTPAPSGRRGGQKKFSDHAIETALILRLAFKLPLRQAEGFLRSVLSLMGVDLEAPDHTTLSRRAKDIEVQLPTIGRSTIHLIVDSSGLQITGEGPWSAAKHGKKTTREWRKLHIGVDENGVILAEKVTDNTTDDASVVPDLVNQIPDDKRIVRFTADGAYDQNSIYQKFAELGARVVMPPVKRATTSNGRSRAARARNRTVNRIWRVGRRQWKKEARYHSQARAENTFFRYKQLFGSRLQARHPGNQQTEARLACSILNRMLELGAPRSRAIRS